MKKHTIILLGASLLLSLPSCSLFNKTTETSSSKTKTKKEVILPQDRQAVQQKANAKTYTPEEFAKGIIKGDWSIETVFGQEAVGEKAPYLKFNDGKVYGNNGCNTINALFEYNASAKTLTFSEVAVTMMLCHKEGITDIQINMALNDTRKYALNKSDDGYTMQLLNADDEVIMTLSHQNFEFLNGTWKVTAIDNEPVNIEKMKLVFDIDERKIHGNTGCNVLNGRLETDMEAPNSISFEDMAVTMMYCPDIEYQTAMLVALENACKAKPIDRNKVLLLDTNGEPVLTLERTSDK